MVHGEATRDFAQGCIAAAVGQWGTRAVQAAESVATMGPVFRVSKEGRTHEMQTVTMEAVVEPIMHRQQLPPLIA
eukprot:12901033-Prorocentrum_lima.AAC.1